MLKQRFASVFQVLVLLVLSAGAVENISFDKAKLSFTKQSDVDNGITLKVSNFG